MYHANRLPSEGRRSDPESVASRWVIFSLLTSPNCALRLHIEEGEPSTRAPRFHRTLKHPNFPGTRSKEKGGSILVALPAHFGRDREPRPDKLTTTKACKNRRVLSASCLSVRSVYSIGEPRG
ncbi:unnamed protein product [Parascedosporium putredinis]|uniref:Uncharacterized protein n=1 Tax=Parascedosporium putredinis TaxID=1442378 RepID=A0A9P1MEY5_9PEZI|nr:unnamed protein product [Parascedosporium putredinis]CAI8003871.1 unnamed protein product [Parascedosporium putredinis]